MFTSAEHPPHPVSPAVAQFRPKRFQPAFRLINYLVAIVCLFHFWPAYASTMPEGPAASNKALHSSSGASILNVCDKLTPPNQLELWVSVGTLEVPEAEIANQTAEAVASRSSGLTQFTRALKTWEVAPEYTRFTFSLAATDALHLAEHLANELLIVPPGSSVKIQAFHAAHYQGDRLSAIVSCANPETSRTIPPLPLTNPGVGWKIIKRFVGPNHKNIRGQAALELATAVLSLRLANLGHDNLRVRFQRERSGGALTWEKRSGVTKQATPEELIFLRGQWNALRADLIRLEELARAKQWVIEQRDTQYPQAKRNAWQVGYGLCVFGTPDGWTQYWQALESVSRNDIQAVCQMLD